MYTCKIMSYQQALNLHKKINEIYVSCTTEHASLISNLVCTRRQLRFEIIRSNKCKIGMNALSNKFFHISKLISLDNLNYSFVHYKKVMKIHHFVKVVKMKSSRIWDDKPSGRRWTIFQLLEGLVSCTKRPFSGNYAVI